MKYDFSTLDSNDFEQLAMDIINATFGMDLQYFKNGKDKGIDLRFSTASNCNAVVVQAKHWLKSGYQRLYKELEKEELPKIINLHPERYLLVTSISLSAVEKDKLVKLLYPYVLSANDILGKEDLNKYLSALPNIEKKWYKLWLTSVPVLQQVIHNGLLGASEFVASKILRTTQLYVHCSSYDIAFNILQEHKYILITGQPGVGKTTLAYYLTYNLLANGFQLLYVNTDISQASTLFSPDPAAKQVIFFDDFLGENYLEIYRPKTTESAFVLFLERVMAAENKYLILTTRTTIYNNALSKYEKLERMKVDIARNEIVLDQYNILDKARILQKHIYYSELPDNYKDIFLTHKNYWQVIGHPNYNPRLIEFVTSKKHVPNSTVEEYWEFVLQTLRNPNEVWKYFYQYQLSVEERLLLHVVFTQNYSATADDTKYLFQHMLEYEIQHYNHRTHLSPFQNSVRHLLDGTLKKELFAYNSIGRFSFINPSLADFLKHYFLGSDEERRKLLLGACTIEQFEHYQTNFFTFEIILSGDKSGESAWFANLLMDRASCLRTYQQLKQESNRRNYLKLRVAALLCKIIINDLTIKERIEQFVYNAINNYSIEEINSENSKYFVEIISYVSLSSETYSYIESKWDAIINALFKCCTSENDFDDVKSLFNELGQNYDVYLANSENESILSDYLNDLVNKQTEEWIQDDIITVISGTDWLNLKQKIVLKRSELFDQFDIEDCLYDESDYFDDDKLQDLIEKNTKKIREQQNNVLENKQQFETTADEYLIQEVELLFTGECDVNFVRKKAEELKLPF